MVDVIDFKDLSTHLVEQRDPSILGMPSAEQLAKEKKSMNKLAIVSVGMFILILVAYSFFHHDRPATGTEVGAYQAAVVPIFVSIRQEFKNLKDITCDEGERADCVSYTFTFSPQVDEQGGAVEGATSADVNRLGEYFNVILQSKLKHLTGRNENLTFKIVSTNVSPTDGETKVTYICSENYGQIQCSSK
jgi:hypothetical protein